MQADLRMMTRSDSTIYEVAQRAGVSISTVSLAMNQPDRLRAATRDRIFAVIDEIGFVPKEQAVVRARAGVGRIAVVAPFTTYPTYSRRLNGVLSHLGRDGTQVIVYDHEDASSSVSPLMSAMPVKGHVDGVIMMDLLLDEKIVARLTKRLPAVLIGGPPQGLPYVDVDDFDGGRQVGDQLAAWGHRRVAFVRDSQVNQFSQSPTQLRLNGLAQVLGAENVIVVNMEGGDGGGRDAVQQLFSGERYRWPTAVFATRDALALKVWQAASQLGLRVPGDVSIIGFDDDAAMEAIGLTTVRNPMEETGVSAVRLLGEVLRGEHPEPVTLPVSLQLRKTAGAASSSDELPQDR
jgi:DNA-binding LacI/PurR family transcriptional regulator